MTGGARVDLGGYEAEDAQGLEVRRERLGLAAGQQERGPCHAPPPTAWALARQSANRTSVSRKASRNGPRSGRSRRSRARAVHDGASAPPAPEEHQLQPEGRAWHDLAAGQGDGGQLLAVIDAEGGCHPGGRILVGEAPDAEANPPMVGGDEVADQVGLRAVAEG